MNGQVNIQDYYPEAKLFKAKQRLLATKQSVSNNTLNNFTATVRKKELHPKLTPELNAFLEDLDTLIKRPNSSTETKELTTTMANDFNSHSSPENTMWQIRFLNYIHDAEMRKQVCCLNSDKEKQNLAGIKYRLASSGPENPWHISSHKSFGRNSRSLEPAFHVFDNFPQSFITVERANDDFSQVLDRATAQDIRDLVEKYFNIRELNEVPDIKFNEDYFETERSPRAIVKIMNKSPIDTVLSSVISKEGDGKAFLDFIANQQNLKDVILNGRDNSSLLDLYLYRLGAHMSGNKILPYYDEETKEAEPFEFGFNPNNYKGKAGLQRLTVEAYNFFKEEFQEDKQAFLDHIFYDNYQHSLNLEKAHNKLSNAVSNYKRRNNENLSFNVSSVIDLGDDLAVYSNGDSTVIPIFHQDAYSSSDAMNKLKAIQEQPLSQVSRLELGENNQGQSKKSKVKPYTASVFAKDEIETLIIASRDLIKNKRKIGKAKNKKLFRIFFNTILAPFISDQQSPKKEKDLKLITDILSYTSEDQSLSITTLGHKISDDNDSEIPDLPDWDTVPPLPVNDPVLA